MFRARNADFGFSVLPRICVVNLGEDKFVYLPHMGRRNAFVLLRERLYIVNGVFMVGNFKMLTQRFAANG